MVDSRDVVADCPLTSSDTMTPESTGSDNLSDSVSVDSRHSPFGQPLSSELIVSLIRPHICWEAAHGILSGADALSIAPGEWRDVIIETFSPHRPSIDICELSPRLHGLYTEATQHMGRLRDADSSSTSVPHNDPNSVHLIEVSLVTSEASKLLHNTLNALPQWIAECYLPLMRCAFKSNDLIEDVSLHLPNPPAKRLCDDVFEDVSLFVLRTETAYVPAALRLSKDSLSRAIPELPRALTSTSSSQLSPRYQVQDLELFSTLVEWHPHHLDIRYRNDANNHPGLWCHGRMAATSPARHLHWLGIQAPVIVVQFDFENISFHLNWPQVDGDRLRCTSSPIWPLGSSQPSSHFSSPLKTWNLRNPAQAVEVALILSNLDRYTSNYFLKEVTRRFSEGGSYKCGPRPWKIDVDLLPMSMIEVEGSRQWREEQELQEFRGKIPQHPPDIRAWLEAVC